MRFLAAVLLGCLLFVAAAFGHDRHGNANWIANGGYRSPVDGSTCCGVGDCAEVDPDDVTEEHGGYRIRGWVTYGTVKDGQITEWVDELVPFVEAQASRDGRIWRCSYRFATEAEKRKQRRCAFFPPPAT